MLYYFNIAILILPYVNVLLIVVGLLDIEPFIVALFDVALFTFHCLMLHAVNAALCYVLLLFDVVQFSCCII